MDISINTSVMARLHPERNGRGLNIYNPYFHSVGVDAVYALFAGADAKRLLEGVRALGIAGGVVAGAFENDPAVAELVDELHPVSQSLGTIGMVSNQGGKLVGTYQGAFGLRDSLMRLTDIQEKSITIFGAGNVVAGLLALLDLEGPRPEISIYNRDAARAERLGEKYPWVVSARPMSELSTAAGDVFVNATKIGSPWNTGPKYVFEDAMVSAFDYVADVTFVPTRPQLIEAADRLGKKYSAGTEMFLHQARFVLRSILGHEMSSEQESVYRKIMLSDFATNWS